MSVEELRVRERNRAIALLNKRWREMCDSYDATEDEQQRDVSTTLGPVIDAAAEEILNGASDHVAAGVPDPTQRERIRATTILKDMFFRAYEQACADSEIDWKDERVPEAINGAERDILGEYVPPELMKDPGALNEAEQNLGITRETRRGPNGFEARWVCATCRTHGEWTTESLLGEPLTHQHAATHTVGESS